MPRQPARVEVRPLEPPKYMDVLEDSGLISHFEIFLEHATGKQRVQCDYCGLFISVTSGGHPIFFTKHRDSDECKKEVRRNAKKRAKDTAQASTSETQRYTIASTPIINDSTSNLTPRQSHVNLHHLSISYPDSDELPIASSAPQSPGSEFDDLLSWSLEEVQITSCENDGGGDNSDHDSDLDERGYLKVPEYDVCVGLAVQWIAGSLWDSYAYQEHEDDNLGWKPIAFDENNWIRLRADNCTTILAGEKELNSRVCSNCAMLIHSKKLRRFMERAKGNEAPAHTPWKYLTTRQLRTLLLSTKKQNEKYRLKVNLSLMSLLVLALK